MQETTKSIEFGDSARSKLFAGVNKLANAVKETMGPRGRSVIIEREFGPPHITKDGVSVAKEVVLKDPFENLGSTIIKEVAAKTADEAGDGTTTSIVLAQAITNESVKYIVAGASPVELKRGMDKMVLKIIDNLREIATPVTDISDVQSVACISANNDMEIGNIIAQAIDSVGKDGVITISESGTSVTTLAFEEGLQVQAKLHSKNFIPANQTSVTFENAFIILVDQDLHTHEEYIEILKKIYALKRPAVFICNNLAGSALSTAVHNAVNKGVQVACIQSPGYGDSREALLEDIAIATGSSCVYGTKGHQKSLRQAELSELGVAESIIITRNNSSIFGGKANPEYLDNRVKALSAELDITSSEFEKEKIQKRIGTLTGGVAVIRVGGNSDVEVKEVKDRVEDALHATRAAIKGGIVPGGGVALIWATSKLRKIDADNADQQLGADLLLKAVEAPLFHIVTNAGKSGEVILAEVRKGKKGYNAHTGVYQDLVANGVIDPVNVTISALTNAVSVAGTLLTTSCAIVTDKVDNPFLAGMTPPM